MSSISGEMGNPTDPTADRTGAFAQLVKATGEFILANAQAQLALSQADVAEAQANREVIGNEELQLRVDRMQRQMELLDAARIREANDLKTANEHIRRIAQLEAGGRTNRWVFYSLEQMLVILANPKVIQNVMGKPLPAYGPENFGYNIDASGTTEALMRCPEGNVGQLLAFAKQQKYQFIPFAPAHMAVADALEMLSDAAQAKAADIEVKVAELRDQAIAALPKPAGSATETPTPTEGSADGKDSTKA